MSFGTRAAQSADDGTSLSPSCSKISLGLRSVDSSLGHSFRILWPFLFVHDNPPGLDPTQDLFTVFLPRGVVHFVQEGNGSEGVLDDFLGSSIGCRHLDSIVRGKGEEQFGVRLVRGGCGTRAQSL